MQLRRRIGAVAAGALLGACTFAAPAHADGPRFTPEQPAIINGAATTTSSYDARWRAIAAVLTTTSWGSTLCGGTVLDERTVLTAAHCTYGPSGATLAPGDMEVVVGRRIANDTGGDRIDVQAITRHPSFDRSSMRNDLAVLRLARAPSVPVGYLQLTSLADQAWWGGGLGQGVGSEAIGPWIAGWGATNASGTSFPAELHEARVPIASDASCAQSLAPGHGSNFDRDSMVCAGLPGPSTGTGVDTCQGDSGGPLIIGDGAGSWRLVGITSWGLDCGGRYYGAYTRVGRYVQWIEPLRFSASPTPLSPTVPPTVTPPPPAPGTGTVPGATTSIDGTGPTPQGSAVGPIAVAGTGTTDAAPTRPTRVQVRARGRGWIRVTWRPATDDRRIRTYRVLVRTASGRWRLARQTPRTSVTLTLRRGRLYALAIQAVDDTGHRSRLSPLVRARTR